MNDWMGPAMQHLREKKAADLLNLGWEEVGAVSDKRKAEGGITVEGPSTDGRTVFMGVDYGSSESVCYEITMDGDKIVSVELLSDQEGSKPHSNPKRKQGELTNLYPKGCKDTADDGDD